MWLIASSSSAKQLTNYYDHLSYGYFVMLILQLEYLAKKHKPNLLLIE